MEKEEGLSGAGDIQLKWGVYWCVVIEGLGKCSSGEWMLSMVAGDVQFKWGVLACGH